MVVESFTPQGQSKGLLDSVGLMVYTGAQSLDWVAQYTGHACSGGWCALCDNAKVSTPCASVPRKQILAGLDGGVNQSDLSKVCSGGTGGYMVWYASVDNGFQYGGDGDARTNTHVTWACNPAELVE